MVKHLHDVCEKYTIVGKIQLDTDVSELLRLEKYRYRRGLWCSLYLALETLASRSVNYVSMSMEKQPCIYGMRLFEPKLW